MMMMTWLVHNNVDKHCSNILHVRALAYLHIGECSYAIVMCRCPSVYVTKSARRAVAAPWVAQLSFLARLKGKIL